MITFTVNTKPRGKERARHGKYSTYSTKSMIEYEREIAIFAKQEMIRKGVSKTKSPLLVKIFAYFDRPQSWPSWKTELAINGKLSHTSTPDTDNICKAVFDAMNDVVYFDDKQIEQHSIVKQWAAKDELKIIVKEFDYIPSTIKTKRELEEWQNNQ